MNEPPLFVLQRFVDKTHKMTMRMAEDPDFYALCQDYEICVKALQYWTASREPEAAARLDEYRNLVHELENEIIGELKSSDPQYCP